jgi:K+-transporting ATPase A subunit
MNNFTKRLANLLSVKSIVTIACTAVFAYQAVTNTISQDFMTIYAVIIAFYFGTQSQKVQDAITGKGGAENDTNA